MERNSGKERYEGWRIRLPQKILVEGAVKKYVIEYSALFDPKEMTRFPRSDLRKIKETIEKKLTTHPEVFGKPLRRSRRGYRRLRVGDYRVIFRINEDTVKIFAIEIDLFS